MPQAGHLAQTKVVAHLAAHGYRETRTPMLFTHDTDKIFFSLVVDDFLIAHSGGAGDRLYAVLRKVYELKVNPVCHKYCGMTLAYAPDRSYVDVSCPGYVQNALKLLGVAHTRTEHAPERHTPVNYGSKEAQLATQDDSPPLSPADTKRLQRIVGIFLWYARVIDGTMLGAVCRLGSKQAHPTARVLEAAEHLLQYAATYPDATLRWYKSDMLLSVDADGSYLSEADARSRAAVFINLVSRTADSHPHNHPVELKSSIIGTVVSSTSACEYASTFEGGQLAFPLRTLLEDLGWPQPPTTITTDNSTACGIANKTTKDKRSKAIDMRYHWIRDRVALKDFAVSWRAGKESLADFLTKAHPASHCREVRHQYVLPCEPYRAVPPTMRHIPAINAR